MSKPIQRIEIISGGERRRRYSAEEKVRLVEETTRPGVTGSAVARLRGVSTLHRRRDHLFHHGSWAGRVFRPIRSPESNGVCDAFLKTLKCGYVGVNLCLDAISVLRHPPTGSTTRTPSTLTAACACARRVSSSPSSQPPWPNVRFNGVRSTRR